MKLYVKRINKLIIELEKKGKIMDYKNIESFNEGIIIKDVENFELDHIFECGQCFRWNKQANGNYIGVAYGKVIEIEKKDKDVKIYNINEEEFNKIGVIILTLKEIIQLSRRNFRRILFLKDR